MAAVGGAVQCTAAIRGTAGQHGFGDSRYVRDVGYLCSDNAPRPNRNDSDMQPTDCVGTDHRSGFGLKIPWIDDCELGPEG